MDSSVALTVTQFVTLVNAALMAVEKVTVEGEIEEYKVIQGKWVVFDLKDEKSLVKCFMPLWNLKTAIEDGMVVRAVGEPKLRPKGFFSFVVDSVQPAGEGALKRAFELLKKKLESEGLFAPERKRPLPRFPHLIALITSRDAAAYGDFLKVLAARHGGLTIYFFHTAVQGEEAPTAILAALEQANTSSEAIDVIVLVRGGGSIEDLQAFNDERVVRAVAGSRLPTVVGIGHERDVSLAELAADCRASTPSNAAELVVRNRLELTAELDHQRSRLLTLMHDTLQRRRQRVSQAVGTLRLSINRSQQRVRTTVMTLAGLQRRFGQRITFYEQRVTTYTHSLRRQITETLRQRQQQSSTALRLLRSLSPEGTLRRGYSITRTKNGRLVKAAADVTAGQALTIQVADGTIDSIVTPGAASQLDLGL